MKVNSRQVVEFNKEIEPLKKKQAWVKQEMKTLGSQVKPQNEALPPEHKKWKRAPQTPDKKEAMTTSARENVHPKNYRHKTSKNSGTL